MAEAPSSPTPPAEHDPLAKALGPSPIEAFIEENKGRLILGFGTLIVVVVGAIILFSQRQTSRLEAAQAFTSAATLTELNQVIERQAGTIDAGNAMLAKADQLKREGKAAEARTTLTEFCNQYRQHPRFAQGLVALGEAAESAGDRSKARESYQQVPSDSDLVPLAKMRLADLLFQEGRIAEARDAYTEIEREFTQNPWATPLKERIKDANLQLNKPEWPAVVLEKPEPPPPPPAPAKPAESKPGTAPRPDAAKPAAPTPPAKPADSKPAPAPAPKADAPKPAAPAPSPAKPAESKPAPTADTPKPAAPATPAVKPVEAKPVQSAPAPKPAEAKP